MVFLFLWEIQEWRVGIRGEEDERDSATWCESHKNQLKVEYKRKRKILSNSLCYGSFSDDSSLCQTDIKLATTGPLWFSSQTRPTRHIINFRANSILRVCHQSDYEDIQELLGCLYFQDSFIKPWMTEPSAGIHTVLKGPIWGFKPMAFTPYHGQAVSQPSRTAES